LLSIYFDIFRGYFLLLIQHAAPQQPRLPTQMNTQDSKPHAKPEAADTTYTDLASHSIRKSAVSIIITTSVMCLRKVDGHKKKMESKMLW
jgi:hypothetical protein